MKSVLLILLASVLHVVGCDKSFNEQQQRRLPTSDIDDRLQQLSSCDLEKTVVSMPRFTSELPQQATLIGRIPQGADIISDWPRYFLYHLPNSDDYWIEEIGGFGGTVTRYGPFSLDAALD